ncbi:T9SS type A sorting domain-containing protein [Lacinutrix chionoecetis]
MKKLLLAFLLFITFTQVNSQQQQELLIDVPETWETDIWLMGSWTFTSIVTYTFNTDCMPTQGLLETNNFATNMLENSALLTTTYNANNLFETNVNQTWNSTTNMWEDSFKSEFEYDGNNNPITITNFAYVSNAWIPVDRLLQTFTANNLYLTSTAQNWDGSSWVDSTRAEFTYNANNTLDIVYNYVKSGSNWVNNTRVTNMYSGNLIFQKETSQWDGSNWINNSLTTYTFDSNNFLINQLEQTWNGTVYEDQQRVLRTNNADGNPTERITQNYLSGSWTNATRDTRTYPPCATLSVEDFEDSILKVFPNPVLNTIHITSHKKGHLLFLDLNGRTLLTTTINTGNNTVDIGKVQSGVYVLKIKIEKSILTRRVIVK